jgi:hypothetical protein
MPIALSAIAMLAFVASQQAQLPPSEFDRSIELTEKFRRMLLRDDAQKVFDSYVKSTARSRAEKVSELRQAGFDYAKNRNGCDELYGGARMGQLQASVTAYVWLCPNRVGAKIGYSPF